MAGKIDVRKSLDVAANVAVLVASVALLVWLAPQIRARWSGDAGPRGRPQGYAAGDTAPTGVDYSRAPKTILLFVRSTCRYCTESMPFYRDLAASAERQSGRIKMVVASFEPADTTSGYIKQYQLSPDEVVMIGPDPKLFATPTLLLVDRTSRVIGSWVGMQPESKQDEIEALLRQAS